MPQGLQHTAPPRAGHEARILDHLRRRGRASRGEIATALGLSRATVSTVTGQLVRTGTLVVAPATESGRLGRRPEVLSLDPSSGLVLGLDFGHTHVTVVATDASHTVVGSGTRRFPATTSWTRRREIAVGMATHVLATTDRPESLAAVGIGVAGSIAGRPAVLEAIEATFADAFAVPVRTDNNARLAGLAEWLWGAAQGATDVMYLRLSHGVGGALVIDGRMRRGPRASGGEFGHVCVDPAGPACRCTNRGCLERYVGLDAVLAEAGADDVGALLAALDRGDDRAVATLGTASDRIGLVLGNVATVLDTPRVVLGGELAALGDHLVVGVRRAMSRHVLPDKADALDVRPAALGARAGALGGVALVLQDTSIPLPGAPRPA
ncbi:ROK family protein [Beutenbergia cavernae DSM 12333]|uniref:ROK family protein n=1 Tax=Beutenbergia cavernae (strain ATCC BAA-8 / DSM 12333 / CCUG 43141 / JCM 11478 / NBRC 16432 / NCIMB 13614 / HKI 0122) TaxID=471853 RepID=C5BVK1_BEUC1|nr:ROK family transcriptional regulator [Beutenbergia cavernae]ACQ78441.1 ROK family protein [Beutenbergia cavernae DSM 12333]